MEVMKKIAIALIAIVCITTIFTSYVSTVNASSSSVKSTITDIGTGTTVSAGGFTEVIKKVLGLLRLLTGLLSIIVIAYTGFELVTETPEGKKKVKEKMIPIVLGVLLVFMATAIATFIVGIFE